MAALYFCAGGTNRDRLVVVAAGVLLALIRGYPADYSYPGGTVVTTAAYIGAAGLLALAWRGPRDTQARGMLLRCMALVGMNCAVTVLLDLNRHVAAWKLDHYLYALDVQLTGTVPAFLVASSSLYSYLRPTQLLIYFSLPLATMLVYAGHLRHSRPAGVNFLLIATANMVVGYALYLYYPAAGPAYAFPVFFPHHLPASPGLHAIPLGAAANAMPSLHVSAALLIWWNSRHWRRARYAALAYLALTALATIGLGEHYCMDLIVAAPYALFIQALGTACASRWKAAAAGGTITILWLVLLRHGFPLLMSSGGILRLMCLASVGLTLWLALRLLQPAGSGSRSENGVRRLPTSAGVSIRAEGAVPVAPE